MKEIKAGVIGLGVGERHIVSYKQISHCEVKSICDISTEKLHDVGERNKIANRYIDYRAITEDPEIDVVSICSYDDIHTEQAISALQHGKHIMVEKPIAVTDEQADLFVHNYQRSESLITSNLILRHCPRFKELKQRIENDEMGNLHYLEGDYIHWIPEKIVDGWRGEISFYSPIFGGAIHMIDLIRWLTHEEVEAVCAMGSNKTTASSGYRFDDTNVILLKFPSGILAKVLVTLVPKHPKFHALKVFGSKATFENQPGDAMWFKSEDPENFDFIETPYPGVEKGDLLPDFVDAIRNNRQPAVCANDVFNVMDICLAAQESRKTESFVKIKYRYQ